jgi:hypothetical protein
MVHIITRPSTEQKAYAVRFHVRAPARWDKDALDQRLRWSLERMISRLARQGWTFVRMSDQPPRGPLPVVPIKGVGKRPISGPRTPLAKDDSLWRVSTLPTFGPKAAHLMTDEVDWEYTAIFARAAITTEYVAPEEGERPTWLKR